MLGHLKKLRDDERLRHPAAPIDGSIWGPHHFWGFCRRCQMQQLPRPLLVYHSYENALCGASDRKKGTKLQSWYPDIWSTHACIEFYARKAKSQKIFLVNCSCWYYYPHCSTVSPHLTVTRRFQTKIISKGNVPNFLGGAKLMSIAEGTVIFERALTRRWISVRLSQILRHFRSCLRASLSLSFLKSLFFAGINPHSDYVLYGGLHPRHRCLAGSFVISF